eukprot:CAMPEP_0204876970 /NCGR_PEP_ID=MMETSP1348-20121228/47934_1 /ASSEMBLY_ACC=CAM_ASM_000700 /TAXON_ID=215587 /ORGANISM="Aplanochytrium stocchinoi, Strain GSBS06" /LENGTH=479 /DNA_ID=CAMNT_0052033793 /DNA_START=779 /DNA_END=2218 /DNA_ORIENTATION=-
MNPSVKAKTEPELQKLYEDLLRLVQTQTDTNANAQRQLATASSETARNASAKTIQIQQTELWQSLSTSVKLQLISYIKNGKVERKRARKRARESSVPLSNPVQFPLAATTTETANSNVGVSLVKKTRKQSLEHRNYNLNSDSTLKLNSKFKLRAKIEFPKKYISETAKVKKSPFELWCKEVQDEPDVLLRRIQIIIFLFSDFSAPTVEASVYVRHAVGTFVRSLLRKVAIQEKQGKKKQTNRKKKRGEGSQPRECLNIRHLVSLLPCEALAYLKWKKMKMSSAQESIPQSPKDATSTESVIPAGHSSDKEPEIEIYTDEKTKMKALELEELEKFALQVCTRKGIASPNRIYDARVKYFDRKSVKLSNNEYLTFASMRATTNLAGNPKLFQTWIHAHDGSNQIKGMGLEFLSFVAYDKVAFLAEKAKAMQISLRNLHPGLEQERVENEVCSRVTNFPVLYAKYFYKPAEMLEVESLPKSS